MSRRCGGPARGLISRAAVKTELLRRIYACGEFRAHVGQHALVDKRLRMRGAEDLPSPLNHVLNDCLGFEQVVACDNPWIKTGRVEAALR